MTYTLLAVESNTFEPLGDIFPTEAEARAKARTLTDEARAEARDKATGVIRRFIAVRTLDSITRNTQPSELTVADIRWLAGEAVDTLDFWIAVPDWARKTIDEVCDRRTFSEKYVKHFLAALRCALSVNRQMVRQVERHEAQAGKRKFG